MSNIDTSFKLLPTNRVVSAFETREDTDTALATLLEAGFSEDAVGFHHGEEGKAFIDADGSRHGFLARVTRQYQRFSGPEASLLDMAEAALNAGHYLVSVLTDGSEMQQAKAREAMAPHTNHTIFFCGRFTIEILKIGTVSY